MNSAVAEEIILSFLFSSFYFILVPSLAAITGGIAGRFTPTVSSAHGSAAGLALDIFALAWGFFLLWVLYRLGGWSPLRPWVLVIFLIPPALALLAPPGQFRSPAPGGLKPNDNRPVLKTFSVLN